MKSLTAEVDEVISKMAISWEWADPKRGLKSFNKREGLGCRKAPYSKLPSQSRKGNRLIFRCWILVSSQGLAFWDLFVATQENLKTGERGGGRDLFSA